jgi:hypothetical protein
MNLGPTLVSSTYQYLLNQSGSSITLGDNSSVNWGGNNLVATTGNQSIGGIKTFTSNISIPSQINFTSNGSFTKNGNHAVTLTTSAASNITFENTASRTYRVPNVGDSSFVMTTGSQSIGGVKSFLGNVTFTGNVGIGDSNPADKLDVIGNGVISRFAGTTNEFQGIVVQPTQSSASVAKGAFIDYRNENDIPVTSEASYHYTNGSSDYYIHTTPIGSRATDRRVERFRIKGNGDTVIGPASGLSLQVVGGIRARGGVPGANGVNNNGYAFSSPGDTGAGMFSSADNQIEFYSNAVEVARIANGSLSVGTTGIPNKLNISGGNIGVYGSSATAAKLHLYNNALNTNGLEIGQGFANGSDNIAYIYNKNNADLIFGTNNTTRVTITNNGNVGIGTGSPSNALEVAGVIKALRTDSIYEGGHIELARATDNVTAYYIDVYGNTNTNNQFRIIDSINVVDRFNINNSGGIGIGNVTAGSDSILRVDSTNRGFLPPRMTTAQRDAILTPSVGLMIYNTSTNRINVRTLSAWSGLAYGPA